MSESGPNLSDLRQWLHRTLLSLLFTKCLVFTLSDLIYQNGYFWLRQELLLPFRPITEPPAPLFQITPVLNNNLETTLVEVGTTFWLLSDYKRAAHGLFCISCTNFRHFYTFLVLFFQSLCACAIDRAFGISRYQILDMNVFSSDYEYKADFQNIIFHHFDLVNWYIII